MSSPQEFMEKVMPWPGPSGPGWVNLHWTKDKKWRGRPFKDAGDFIQLAQWLTMKPSVADDIYFCMTVQSQTGKEFNGVVTAARSAGTATLVKALWLDVDVKAPPKGYATLNDALDAVTQFVAAAHLPNPSALVHSGGGLHVYWVFDHALTIEEWLPYAEGLKVEAMRLGLRADHGVTADPARVLRVPGTFNRKLKNNPRPVRVLALGEDCTEAELAGLVAIGRTKLAATVTAAVTRGVSVVPFDLSAFQGKTMAAVMAHLNPITDNLSDGLNTRSDLPLNPDEVFRHCGHFQDAGVTHGQKHGQGLWMLTVLASTWFEDGRMWAHHFSKDYPTYDPPETDAMFDRKLTDRANGVGWPSCVKIEDEGSTACKTCPFRGKLKSPLNLAERVAPPLELAARTGVPAAPEDLRLPPGYTVNPADGIICYVMEVQNEKKGTFSTELMPMFDGRITGTPWCEDGEPKLHFTYEIGTHRNEITVPYDALSSDQLLSKCLSGQTVMTITQNDKYVRAFMKSWVSQITAAYRRQISAPFGWVIEDGKRRGFAYGGQLWKADGTSEAAGHPDRVLQASYTPTGTEAPINRLLDMISQQKHWALEVLALQSFASPLLYVTGLKAAVCWPWSDQSGAQKSTAISTGMALWSAPGKTKENGFTSNSGLEIKMGQLQNLPVVIDEITSYETLGKLMPAIQMASEGQAGQRARRNRTLAVHETWKLILLCGSNKSMHEYQNSHNTQTDAGPMRVFEIKVDKRVPPHSSNEADTLIDSLDYNFGHIGLRYAQYLATHVNDLATRGAALDKEIETLTAPYHKEERFWKALVVTTVLAADVANEVLGRLVFHTDEVKAFLVDTFLANRNWVATNVKIGGSIGEAENIIGRFLDQYINNQLVTADLNTGRGIPKTLIPTLVPPENAGRGNPVYIHWATTPRIVRIAVPALSDFIESLDLAAPSTIKAITQHFNGVVKKRVNMLAGVNLTQVKIPCDVLEIVVQPGSPLDEAMQSRAPTAPANPISAAIAGTTGATASSSA